MEEIRIHGRGGQGAITSGQILAIAAFFDGKRCQTFPTFGVERTGAPVTVFARISDQTINLRSHIYNPNVVIVLDPSLIKTLDVTQGLEKHGYLLVNTNKSPEELKKEIKGDFQIHTVDATTIAMEIFKRPIINTLMLGAYSKILKKVTLKSLKKAISVKLSSKGEKIEKLNEKAIEIVYNLTK